MPWPVIHDMFDDVARFLKNNVFSPDFKDNCNAKC